MNWDRDQDNEAAEQGYRKLRVERPQLAVIAAQCAADLRNRMNGDFSESARRDCREDVIRQLMKALYFDGSMAGYHDIERGLKRLSYGELASQCEVLAGQREAVAA